MTGFTRRQLLKFTGAVLSQFNRALGCFATAVVGAHESASSTVSPTGATGITAAVIGTAIYPRTAAEIFLGISPTNYAYQADPLVDPRRYGADPTGVVDATTAVQTAINVAYQGKGCISVGNQCNFLVGALSLALASDDNDINFGLRIMGSSTNGSRLTVNGTPSSILNISAAVPAGAPQRVSLLIENLTLQCSAAGAASAVDGIVIQNLAGWTLRKVTIYGANRCLFDNSALTGLVEDCAFSRSNYGVYSRTNGGGAPPNLIKIKDTSLDGCGYYAIDYDTGSELQVENCDIEQNGTSATFTANPPAGATSGTLTASWPLATGAYACFFPDGETRTVILTKGAATATWTGGLANTQMAAWLGTPTGAIHIGGNINAAPRFGLAKISLRNNWIEQSSGGYAIQMDAPLLGQETWLSIDGGHIISSSNALAMNLVNVTHLSIRHFYSPDGAGAVWNLSYTYGCLQDVLVTTLNDTGTYPTYINVVTSTAHYANGRVDNFTATLTGVSGSHTGNVHVQQQGDEIVLDFFSPPIVGPSASATFTLTGLPKKYWPITDTIGRLTVQNNSTNAVQPVQVASATGVITLGFAVTLVNAGNSGVVGGQLRYRRP